jgi:hypothetical protein
VAGGAISDEDALLRVSQHRTGGELRAAQLVLASVTLSHPRLGGADAAGEAARRWALYEVLNALGIGYRVSDAADDVPRPARRGCAPWTGTTRGYRRHIAAYAVPCPDCRRAREEELHARWAELGINADSSVRLPT